jgi:acyl carrier protein
VNVYGPTECTDLSATHHAGPAEVCAVSVVPIGRPVHNARLYVVDRQGEPLPAGVPGELWVAGGNLSRGYLGRPALTAERFVPAAQLGEARAYRTGDRVRLRPDGVLEFLGRMDDQVKIRGARVEPGEVEKVLSGHPAVHEAVVVARTGEGGHPVLVAYVIPRAGSGEEAAGPALAAWLRERLPEPLVPSAWVRMDEFPLSPNGKVDRRSLPAPEAGAAARFVAPRTALEEVLARIWTEVLPVERVGVEDSFFDLGGHSLLATQVVSRVRDTLRVELPLRDIFGAPTVAALAGVLGGGEGGERLEEAAALVLRLERMSDEEVQAELRSRGGAGNGAAP